MIKIEEVNIHPGTATRISYVDDINKYEVYVQMRHPLEPMDIAIMLKALSDKIRWKEGK